MISYFRRLENSLAHSNVESFSLFSISSNIGATILFRIGTLSNEILFKFVVRNCRISQSILLRCVFSLIPPSRKGEFKMIVRFSNGMQEFEQDMINRAR